jgi:hypothetical protein
MRNSSTEEKNDRVGSVLCKPQEWKFLQNFVNTRGTHARSWKLTKAVPSRLSASDSEGYRWWCDWVL